VARRREGGLGEASGDVDGARENGDRSVWWWMLEHAIVPHKAGDTRDRLRGLVDEIKAAYGLERMNSGWRWTKG